MLNLAVRVLRRSVLATLILATAGCGEGESVVVQAKSDKLDRIKKGSETKAPSSADPKTK